MLEDFVKSPVILGVVISSIYYKSLENLTQYLLNRGHTIRMMREYIRVAIHFVYWATNERIALPMEQEEVSRCFNAHFVSCLCPVSTMDRNKVRAGLNHLMHVFREDGYVVLKAKHEGPVDIIIEEFKKHLISVCGASKSTCRQYSRYARQFLKTMYGEGPFDVATLTVNDIQEFIIERAHHCDSWAAKAICTAIRSFLRYMAFLGLCNDCLVNAVPTIPQWKYSSLPKALSEEQVSNLLMTFDLSQEFGRRDHAIVLCLLRLGLRANEIARLSLDEIDWRKGIMHFHHGKGQRVNLLPLAADIGKEIANYVRYDRPPTQHRNIFLQHRPPIGEPLKSCTVQAIVRRAFKRSDMMMEYGGSHVLRHTTATRMIQAGATIKEVADILGHRCISTTGIYAKVDLPALLAVAMPWPRGQ